MSTVLLFGVSGTDDIGQNAAEHLAYIAGACGDIIDTFISDELKEFYDVDYIYHCWEQGRDDVLIHSNSGNDLNCRTVIN